MGHEEVRTLGFDLAMLCFDLAVRCAGSANRRLEVSSQLGPQAALMVVLMRHLIGDGDICKIFALVALLLRYCNAVERQEKQGPR